MSNQPSTFSSNQTPKVHCTLRGTMRITVYHSVFHRNAMPWAAQLHGTTCCIQFNTPHHTTDWYRLHRMIYWDYCMPRMAWRHAQVTGTITATLWPYGYPLTWLVNPAKLFGMCQKLKTQNDQKRTWENLPACRQFDSFLECSPGCQVTTTLIRPSFSHWSLSLAHRCPTWPSTQLGSSDSLVLP